MFFYFSCVIFARMLVTIVIFICLRPCIKRKRARANGTDSWVTRFDPKPLAQDFPVYSVENYGRLLALTKKSNQH